MRLCMLEVGFEATSQDGKSHGAEFQSRSVVVTCDRRVVSARSDCQMSVRRHGVLEHADERRSRQVGPSTTQEESMPHLFGSVTVRPERKYSSLLVIRSMMSMGPQQTGQRSCVMISG